MRCHGMLVLILLPALCTAAFADDKAAGEQPKASQNAAGKVSSPKLAADLAPPVLIDSAGKPIDAEGTGHAAPFVGDFDGDGKADLLVGQYHEGKLRIYRNTGTNAQPKFEGHEWFKAGAELGRVPVG